MGLRALKGFLTYIIVTLVITAEAASVVSSASLQRDADSERNHSVFSISSTPESTTSLSDLVNFFHPLVDSADTRTPSTPDAWAWLHRIFQLPPLPTINWWAPVPWIWQTHTVVSPITESLQLVEDVETQTRSQGSPAVSRFAEAATMTSRAPATKDLGKASSLKRTTESAGEVTTPDSAQDAYTGSTPKPYKPSVVTTQDPTLKTHAYTVEGFTFSNPLPGNQQGEPWITISPLETFFLATSIVAILATIVAWKASKSGRCTPRWQRALHYYMSKGDSSSQFESVV